MKKCLSIALCAVLLVCLFAGCGQKSLVTEFASGWKGFNLSVDQCKEQVNKLIQSDSNKIGEMESSVSEGKAALTNMEKTVHYFYDYADNTAYFSITEDGGEGKVFSIGNTLYTDKASQDGENAWKEINRAILRTALPNLSEKKCEEILAELGETDNASRSEGYEKDTVVDGVQITLRFVAAEPGKSYTKNYIYLSVASI